MPEKFVNIELRILKKINNLMNPFLVLNSKIACYRRAITLVLLMILSVNITGSYFSFKHDSGNITRTQPALDQYLDEFILSANINHNTEKPEKVVNTFEYCSSPYDTHFTKNERLLINLSKVFSFKTRFKTFLSIQFSTST